MTSGRSSALAYAAAVNLKPGDVPGMQVVADEREAPAPTAKGLALDRCYGDLGDRYHIAKVDSDKFSSVTGDEHVLIYSNVEVMPTETLAVRNNTVNASPRAFACARRFLPRALAEEGGPKVHFGRPVITRTPVPLPGGYGVTMSAAILGLPTAIEPTQPRFFTDGFAFLSDRAEIGLIVTAFPRPLPAASETRLVSLLYQRAEAHELG